MPDTENAQQMISMVRVSRTDVTFSIWSPLGERKAYKASKFIISFAVLHLVFKMTQGKDYYPHLTDRKIEPQRCEDSDPKTFQPDPFCS